MTAALDGAREALRHAAANYAPAYPNPGPEWDDLCRAALTYAEARRMAQGEAARTQSYAGPKSGVVLPFGQSKGLDVTEAKTNDLEWISGALQTSIDNPDKERWRQSNETLKAAVDAEIARRAAK